MEGGAGSSEGSFLGRLPPLLPMRGYRCDSKSQRCFQSRDRHKPCAHDLGIAVEGGCPIRRRCCLTVRQRFIVCAVACSIRQRQGLEARAEIWFRNKASGGVCMEVGRGSAVRASGCDGRQAHALRTLGCGFQVVLLLGAERDLKPKRRASCMSPWNQQHPKA